MPSSARCSRRTLDALGGAVLWREGLEDKAWGQKSLVLGTPSRAVNDLDSPATSSFVCYTLTSLDRAFMCQTNVAISS